MTPSSCHGVVEDPGKKKCHEWWKKHTPDDVLLEVMLSKIDQAKQTKKWKEEGGQFVPMPLTWLNGARWNDEYQVTSQKKDRLVL